jgi:hypothetical protein
VYLLCFRDDYQATETENTISRRALAPVETLIPETEPDDVESLSSANPPLSRKIMSGGKCSRHQK